MKKWIVVVTGILVLAAVSAQAKITAEDVSYADDNVKLKGYLVYDDAYPDKRPGVLVVHEWWGLNDYARMRAERLASLGYVAFAVDMYGENKVTKHPDQASKWMKEITQNVELWRSRAMAGLDVLKAHPKVDRNRLAAIGYCFGGATVQQLAYSGADVRGVVSFHGSLVLPPEDGTEGIRASFLICHGAADPFVTDETL
ncbi:MAG: dienelactone hydrolase family protein, partial [Deltaproteobacteria bacterium]|nr:dienelactone hydrolase family protein [Deltaproteobacteria bacterium]